MANQNNIHGGLRHGPSIAYTPKLKDNAINSSEPWNAKQSGALSSTVVAETAYGQSSNAGTAVTVSKGDHTHGTPATPTALPGLPVYANNAAAVAGGLAVGDIYRTGGNPDPVCVVH
jgi:hypothetical protein